MMTTNHWLDMRPTIRIVHDLWMPLAIVQSAGKATHDC
jgi:hypothetical protein